MIFDFKIRNSKIYYRKIINFSLVSIFFSSKAYSCVFCGPTYKKQLFSAVSTMFLGDSFYYYVFFLFGKCCCGKWCRTVVNNFFFTLPLHSFSSIHTHTHSVLWFFEILCVCVVLMLFYVAKRLYPYSW